MSSYIGKEITITIGGKHYTLSRLTRSILREFAEWVHAHTPNPLTVCAAYIKDFPPELQKILLQQAWLDSKSRLEIEGPEVRQAMETIEGQTKLLQLLLRQHHPDLTEDEVFDLAQAHFAEQVEALVAKMRQERPDISKDEAEQRAMEEVLTSGTFRLGLPAMPGH